MNLDNNKLKENPYKVPENYFEEFSKKMMDKVEMEEKETKAKKQRFILFRPAVAAAASILVIFTLSLFLINNINKTDNVFADNDGLITEYSIEDYLLAMDESHIFEAIETCNDDEEEILDYTTIEEVLIASVSDYELMY